MSKRWVVVAYVRGKDIRVPNVEPKRFFTRRSANRYAWSLEPMYACYVQVEKW